MIVVLLLKIILAIFLVILNGFFVAAEFAFVRVRESTVEELVRKERKGSESLSKVLDNLDDYLAVTQLGITVSSLGLGWIGEPAFASLVEELIGSTLPSSTAHLIGFTVGFSLITFLHVVFGELAPKTLSIQLTEKISLLVAPPMRFFRYIFIPGIIIFNGAANRFTSFLGVDSASEVKEMHTEEEIRNIIQSSNEEGLVDDDEQKMINRIFEFDDRKLKEIMVPKPEVVSIKKSASVSEAKSLMKESNHTKILITGDEEESIEGFIDVRHTIGSDLDESKVEQLGSEILVLPETTNLDQAFLKMREEKYEIAAIVDEWGSFEGVVTVEDIVEAIFGDIESKFGAKKHTIDQIDEDTYVVSGNTPLMKIRDIIGIDISSEDMDTISGWIMEEKSSVPEEDEEINKQKYKVLISESTDNKVERAIIDVTD